MSEPFVSFEVATLLFNTKFNEPCAMQYEKYTGDLICLEIYRNKCNSEMVDYISAPTFEQAQIFVTERTGKKIYFQDSSDGRTIFMFGDEQIIVQDYEYPDLMNEVLVTVLENYLNQ